MIRAVSISSALRCGYFGVVCLHSNMHSTLEDAGRCRLPLCEVKIRVLKERSSELSFRSFQFEIFNLETFCIPSDRIRSAGYSKVPTLINSAIFQDLRFEPRNSITCHQPPFSHTRSLVVSPVASLAPVMNVYTNTREAKVFHRRWMYSAD